MMRRLQRLGKALMLPVATLPLCGLLMGIGYVLCPTAMQGGDVSGAVSLVGLFLVKAGGVLIDNMAILFALGVGVGLSEDGDGVGGLAALVSWLMIIALLNPDFVQTIIPSVANDANALLAFQRTANPFVGILAGIIGSTSYNRFHATKTPEWLAFFSGKRCVAIVAGVASVLVSAVLLVVWPIVFGLLVSLGNAIAGMGVAGAGIYAFLNRLLIPTGLHHALNNVFWFDTIGLGDLTHFWAGETSADVGWSLGMYMSGFFPCMMFGVPGAALAMVRSVDDPTRRKATAGILVSAALCSFVCGVTEPFEFAFMFAAPLLYVAYAALYGVFTVVTVALGFRAGFAFSAGATDLVFSAPLPAAQGTLLIIPLGIAAFVVFYLVFRGMIKALDLKTPGREDEDALPEQVKPEPVAAKPEAVAEDDEFTAMARGVLAAVGGSDNVERLDSCATRLRLEVRDDSLVDEVACKAAGARGVFKLGGGSVQVVIGMQVQHVADAFKRLLC